MAFKDRAEIETLLRATADEALEFPVASLDEPMVFSSIVEELELCLAVETAFKVQIPDEEVQQFTTLNGYLDWLVVWLPLLDSMLMKTATWTEGFLAYQRGVPASSNPHPCECAKFAEWVSGWRAGLNKFYTTNRNTIL